jgi:hypothetical protein
MGYQIDIPTDDPTYCRDCDKISERRPGTCALFERVLGVAKIGGFVRLPQCVGHSFPMPKGAVPK